MAECRPRLYVYRLPEGYRDPLDTRGRGFGKPLAQAPGLVRGLQVPLYDTDAYAGLGEIGPRPIIDIISGARYPVLCKGFGLDKRALPENNSIALTLLPLT